MLKIHSNHLSNILLFMYLFIVFDVYEAGSHCIAQAGLELMILLPQSPYCRAIGLCHHVQLLLSFKYTRVYYECI
jgi:hypothetical protein